MSEVSKGIGFNLEKDSDEDDTDDFDDNTSPLIEELTDENQESNNILENPE